MFSYRASERCILTSFVLLVIAMIFLVGTSIHDVMESDKGWRNQGRKKREIKFSFHLCKQRSQRKNTFIALHRIKKVLFYTGKMRSKISKPF